MKKTAILLVLAMLVSLFVACGKTDKKKNEDPKPNPEDTPQNELHTAILKTNELSSFEGKMTVAGRAEEQDIQKEIAVSAGYTADNKFAANLSYEDNSGIYFAGDERYIYSGKNMGGPCGYLQRTDLQYDFVSAVLSYVLIPVGELGALQLAYPNSILVYSIEDISYTSRALMALSPKVTDENGETCMEFSGVYADMVKALIPNADNHANIEEIYSFLQYTLTIRVAKEGYISYIGFSQSMADDTAATPILTRTLTIDAVNTNKTMETPRQLTLPNAKYGDYRFCDGEFLYVASPDRMIGQGNHPSELDDFHVRVLVAPFRFTGDTIALLTFPAEFLGKSIVKIYTDMDEVTLEKLVIPKELAGKWECDNKEAEVFVYWERIGAGDVNSKYKNVYYLGEWDMVDGVPMP